MCATFIAFFHCIFGARRGGGRASKRRSVQMLAHLRHASMHEANLGGKRLRRCDRFSACAADKLLLVSWPYLSPFIALLVCHVAFICSPNSFSAHFFLRQSALATSIARSSFPFCSLFLVSFLVHSSRSISIFLHSFPPPLTFLPAFFSTQNFLRFSTRYI